MVAGSTTGLTAVFGGSGFLGREIVRRLSDAGIATRVAVRHPDKVTGLPVSDQSGQISPVYADVRDEVSVALALEGCRAVVNAVGLYVESGAETFEAVHELGALNVAHQCVEKKVDRLVHISGIGTDLYSKSSYIHSRAQGEVLVEDVFPRVTILRPSVLFGPDDAFVNTLAKLAKSSPVLPLFGRGETMLQPVYVGDVADATRTVLEQSGTAGKTYELGGPRRYSYRALVELVMRRCGQRRLLLPVPFPLWQILALILAALPNPPLTADQVALMKRDNVVAGNANTFADLGLEPSALEEVLPRYAF